jgi:hypothetical protein
LIKLRLTVFTIDLQNNINPEDIGIENKGSNENIYNGLSKIHRLVKGIPIMIKRMADAKRLKYRVYKTELARFLMFTSSSNTINH